MSSAAAKTAAPIEQQKREVVKNQIVFIDTSCPLPTNDPVEEEEVVAIPADSIPEKTTPAITTTNVTKLLQITHK